MHDQSVNLLPWRQFRRQKMQRQLMLRCAIYFLLSTMMILLAHIFLLHELKILSCTELTLRAIIQKNAYQLRSNEMNLFHRMQFYTAKRRVAIQRNQQIKTQLQAIADVLPAELTLTSLSFNSKIIVMTGVGEQFSAVHTYQIALAHTALFNNIQLIKITQQKNQALAFQLQLQL